MSQTVNLSESRPALQGGGGRIASLVDGPRAPSSAGAGAHRRHGDAVRVRPARVVEHTAPFDALVQLVEGEMELTIGGKKVQARAGEIVLMPARVSHALTAPVAAKMLLVMLRDKVKE
jgi:hypothetical protein